MKAVKHLESGSVLNKFLGSCLMTPFLSKISTRNMTTLCQTRSTGWKYVTAEYLNTENRNIWSRPKPSLSRNRLEGYVSGVGVHARADLDARRVRVLLVL